MKGKRSTLVTVPLLEAMMAERLPQRNDDDGNCVNLDLKVLYACISYAES